MDLNNWLVFLGMEIVLSLVPGPAVLFVIAQGLRRGTRAAAAATFGILLANAFWFLMSALGVCAVLIAVPGVLTAVRWLGAAYVAWLGIQGLRARAVPLAVATAPDAAPQTGPATGVLRRGFFLQLGNPKALLFFASILPGFVQTHADAWPVWAQIAVLGATSVASEVWVLLGYGALAATASARVRDGRFAQRLDRIAGVVLLGVAAWLLLQ